MRIQNISNVNFKSITPIFTTSLNFEDINEKLKEKAPNKSFEVVDNGNIGFLVTGKDYLSYMYQKSKHSNQTFSVHSIDTYPIEIESLEDTESINTMLQYINGEDED